MKRQVQILLQHKQNNPAAFAKVYDSMTRIYGKKRIDSAIKKAESE